MMQLFTSHINKALSHVLTGTTFPDMYWSNSSTGMFNDSAVKFSTKDTAQHWRHFQVIRIHWYLDLNSYQICEVISSFTWHESAAVAESCNVVNIALQSGRIGFEHHKNQSWQKLVSRSWSILSNLKQLEDRSAAPYHWRQLLRRRFRRIHAQDLCDCLVHQFSNVWLSFTDPAV